MKTQTTTVEEFESTYAMLVRSEEKERSVSEAVAYGLLILSAVVSMWQLAVQPVVVPTNLVRNVSVTETATAAQPAV